MCWCNPNLRSPCCGEMGCNPELDEQAPPSVGEGRDFVIETKHQDPSNTQEVLFKQSQIALWQNYCEKKMECEELRDLLKDAAILLVNGTEEHCAQLSDKIIETLKEK